MMIVSAEKLICVLAIVLLRVRCDEDTLLIYGMDDSEVCEKNSVRAVWLTEGHRAIVVAKTEELRILFGENIMKCSIMFGPKSGEALQYISIKFESFYISEFSCDAQLLVQQSPATFFDRDVKEMAKLNCGSPSPGTLLTEKGNNVKFSFKRDKEFTRDYNFIINVTLSVDPPEESGLSFGVKIGIAAISVAVFLTLIIIIIKTVKLKCDMKDMNEETQQRASSLNSLSGQTRQRTRTNSYTALPEGDPVTPDLQYLQNREDHTSPGVVSYPLYTGFDTIHIPPENILQPPPYEETRPQPPAYDEALSMPKVLTENEDDPPYINIGSVHNNS